MKGNDGDETKDAMDGDNRPLPPKGNKQKAALIDRLYNFCSRKHKPA